MGAYVGMFKWNVCGRIHNAGESSVYINAAFT